MLAALPDAELDLYFAQAKLDRFTPSTLTGEAKLRKELAEVRKTGFAIADEELSLGINGIGHVVSIDGEVIGALSVAIPKVRWDDELIARAKDLLLRTAGLLEAG
jgi:IclR family acetate operon transcriptional repressor